MTNDPIQTIIKKLPTNHAKIILTNGYTYRGPITDNGNHLTIHDLQTGRNIHILINNIACIEEIGG